MQQIWLKDYIENTGKQNSKCNKSDWKITLKTLENKILNLALTSTHNKSVRRIILLKLERKQQWNFWLFSIIILCPIIIWMCYIIFKIV